MNFVPLTACGDDRQKDNNQIITTIAFRLARQNETKQLILTTTEGLARQTYTLAVYYACIM